MTFSRRRIGIPLLAMLVFISAYTDDIRSNEPTGRAIVGHPGHLIVAEGRPTALTVVLTEAGSTTKNVEVTLTIEWPDAQRTELSGQTNDVGRATFSVSSPETTKSGAFRITLRAAAWGMEQTITGDVIDRSEYDRFDTLAASLPLDEPQRILVLGDSLSAQNAGSNQFDKLLFWMDKRHTGKAVIRNAAVGGDSIRTVSRRLQHLVDPKSRDPQFRQEAYDGLFEFHPDVVVIALGQNDTKVTSESHYQKTHMSPEEWERGFTYALDVLSKRTSARIILVSSVSPVEEICRRRAETHVQSGKVHLLYGKPEAMEAFNGFLRTFATKHSLEFYDFYSPTRNHPSKSSLFNPQDGVHLTQDGHRYLSELYLQHLAARQEPVPGRAP